MQVREIRARDWWAGLMNVDIQIPFSVFAWLLDGRCALSGNPVFEAIFVVDLNQVLDVVDLVLDWFQAYLSVDHRREAAFLDVVERASLRILEDGASEVDGSNAVVGSWHGCC